MTTDADQRTPKGERTKARLLSVAIRRFGEASARSVSVSAIAREAGLTPAATYAYFPDKDALFAAAVQTDFDALMRQAVPGSSQERPDSARPMAALFANLLALLPEHPLVSRVMREGTPEQVQLLMQAEGVHRLTAELERGIRQRQAAGRAAHLDPHLLAVGTETIVMALLTSVVRTGLPNDPQRGLGVIAVFDAAFGGAPDDAERAVVRSTLLNPADDDPTS